MKPIVEIWKQLHAAEQKPTSPRLLLTKTTAFSPINDTSRLVESVMKMGKRRKISYSGWKRGYGVPRPRMSLSHGPGSVGAGARTYSVPNDLTYSFPGETSWSSFSA